MACLGGEEHQLEEVFAAEGSSQGDAVVRWCRMCGSVVVDADCDGRTSPGAVLPMQTPSLLTKHIKTREKYAGNQTAYDVLDGTGTLGSVYATRVDGPWAIELCTFGTKELAASAVALLTRAGLLPRH
jgi:hypothetical protein